MTQAFNFWAQEFLNLPDALEILRVIFPLLGKTHFPAEEWRIKPGVQDFFSILVFQKPLFFFLLLLQIF